MPTWQVSTGRLREAFALSMRRMKGGRHVHAAHESGWPVDDSSTPGVTIVQMDSRETAERWMAESSSGESRLGCPCDFLYNERSYGGRETADGRAGDSGRGWCCFEDEVSRELLIRVLAAYPKLRTPLDALPPKLLQLSSSEPMHVVQLHEDSVQLSKRQNVHLHTFLQNPCGSYSVKPTTMMYFGAQVDPKRFQLARPHPVAAWKYENGDSFEATHPSGAVAAARLKSGGTLPTSAQQGAAGRTSCWAFWTSIAQRTRMVEWSFH